MNQPVFSRLTFLAMIAIIAGLPLALQGCATYLQARDAANPAAAAQHTPQQEAAIAAGAAAEQGGLQFLTIKTLDDLKKKDPARAAALASKAHALIAATRGVLVAGVSLGALHDEVTKLIAAQGFDPGQTVAINSIRTAVDIYFQDALSGAQIPASGLLDGAALATVRRTLNSLDEALTLEGYSFGSY